MAVNNGDTITAAHMNAKFETANVDTDNTLAANSDSKVASQKAIKGYVDTKDAANVKKTGAQTIEGVKTFGSIPVLPASDPTADNQAARKKYVDDTATIAKAGHNSYNGLDTGNFNIAHGLGKIPSLVRIRASWNGVACLGVYTSSAQNHMSFRYYGSALSFSGSSNNALGFYNGSNYPYATISVDATNIKLNRQYGGGGSPEAGTVYIYWEAIF